MTLPEMIEALEAKGFIVTWNDDHDTVFVSLHNRTPSTMEVIEAMDYQPMWISRTPRAVVIQED